MKVLNSAMLAAMFASVLTVGALAADVAVGPMYAVVIGIPLLIIAAAVIAVALIIHFVKKRKDK